MFEAERFVADCRAAFAKDPTHKAIREVLARAVSDPTAVLKGLGEPKRAGIQELFHSDALTIINVVWAPGMMVMPHNHRMWAVIGIYTGREDNVFWKRVKERPLERRLCVRWMLSRWELTSSIPLSIQLISLQAPYTSTAAIFSPLNEASGTP